MVDDRARLREMLADLESTLDGLREKQGVSRREYHDDQDLQDIVERRLEKATQTCLDIARRVCRLEGHDVSEDTNADAIATLVDCDVLPETHRQDFVDIAGLRNVLAHRYRHINAGEIYESYHDLERLERFSEAIYLYLQNGTTESKNS